MSPTVKQAGAEPTGRLLSTGASIEATRYACNMDGMDGVMQPDRILESLLRLFLGPKWNFYCVN